MIATFADRLQKSRDRGLYRQRNRTASEQLVVFNSNDYLGLASDPGVAEALAHGAQRYGVGSGGSHLICGHHREHQGLEEELADFVGRDRALLFSSGYMANLGVMQALLDRLDTVVSDRFNHASLIDAAKLSGAKHKRYRHADVASARNLLKNDGLIFISIDDHEVSTLRRMCDEVFGEMNFVACLIWDTNHSAQAGIFKVYHQYILVYAKILDEVKTPNALNDDLFMPLVSG